MATAKKENLGKMPCPCCGGPVAVKKSATGTLSYSCQEADCEATGYAAAHTAVARKWLATLAASAPKPAPPEPPAAAPKPAAVAKTPAKPAPPSDPAPKAPPKPGFNLEFLK